MVAVLVSCLSFLSHSDPVLVDANIELIDKVALATSDAAVSNNQLEFTEADKAKFTKVETKFKTESDLQAELSSAKPLNTMQMEKYRETGSYKGWRLFFENHVDSTNRAIDQSAANTFIAGEIQLLSGESDQIEIEQPLLNFASYLNLLFPELDIQDVPQLNQYQTDVLFNLVFDIQAKRRERSSDDADLQEMLTHINSLQTAIINFYQLKGQCQVYVHINQPQAGDKIIALSISAAAEQQVSDCNDRPDIIEFSEETLWVNDLHLEGSTELAHLGIYQADIDSILESELREKTAYMVNGISGFAKADLINLADTISYLYYNSDGGKLNNVQLANLTQHVMKLREGRGMSFEELEGVADAVKFFYRSKGLILASVYIPQQDFKYANGRIKLALQSGVLGSVEVRGIEQLHYKKAAILRAFKPYIGKSVSDDVSDAYFLVNSLPGLSVQSGLFESGDNPGETKLVLDVKENIGRFSVSADNYGTELTGENRFMVTGDWLNPSGRGDALSLGYLRTGNPSNSNLFFINYQLPLFDAKTALALSFDSNLYEAQQLIKNTFDVVTKGTTHSLLGGLKRKVKSSKDFNMNTGLYLSYKKAETNSTFIGVGAGSTQNNDDTSSGVMLTGHADFLSSALRSVFSIDGSLSYGDVDYSKLDRKDAGFIKYNISSNTNTLLEVTNKVRSKLATTIKASYSDDPLPYFEQFSLGGPYAVRAFSSSAFLGDSGIYASVEWGVDIVDALEWEWLGTNNTLDVGFFYEGAYGSQNRLVSSGGESWAHLAGYGLLARYEWKRNFVIDSSISWPTTADDGGLIELVDKGSKEKMLISFKYIFN